MEVRTGTDPAGMTSATAASMPSSSSPSMTARPFSSPAPVAGRASVLEEDVPEPPGSEERSAEDEAFQSIGRQSMLELIDSLSQEQQQVLTLKFVFNFSNAEAATILDKTEGAIKSLQHRALASLQRQIATSPESPPQEP